MIRSRLHAELVADAGAAAATAEFFRSPTFLRAEGVTHSLVIGDGRVLMPLICREIEGGGQDAVSPYGYPGGTVDGDPPAADEIDFAGTGLVSIFVRERLGLPTFSGGVDRGTVLVHDPSEPRTVHRRIATKVRSNERRGYLFEAVPGAEVDDGLLTAFEAAYTETMHLTGAADRYFFGIDYLRACLRFGGSWLVVVRGPEGDLAAGAIATVSDGTLHYFLGGTADAHRSRSPAKNMMVGMLDLADSLAVPLNLGGGITENDALHTFKASFTNSTGLFRAHHIVCDPEEYARLAAGRERSDFFPAYRAPADETAPDVP